MISTNTIIIGKKASLTVSPNDTTWKICEIQRFFTS